MRLSLSTGRTLPFPVLRISPVILLICSPLFAADEPSFSEIQPLLQTYCYKCHDEEVQKGEFRIDRYRSYGDVLKDRKHWLKVLVQLETGEMPTKEPLPTKEEYRKMIAWVDRAVNDIDWEKLKHPGHVTLPRLTNVEYDHTIRDLLGIDIQAGRILSMDGEGKSGFTNDRDNLFLSSSLLEKYFTAAEWAVDSLIALNDEPKIQHFEAEEMFMTESKSAVSQYADGSRGYVLNRGQMTLYENVMAKHRGIYEFQVRFRSSTPGKAGVVLRINDNLEGELETSGTELKETVLPVFLNPGSYQMAWNFKSYPKAKPPKKSSRNYKPLPADAGEIVNRKSKELAPRFQLDGEDLQNKELMAAVKRWDATEVGIQRPYEWLRLHGPKGNPAELSRFSGYVADRSKELISQEKKIAKLLGLSIDQLRGRYQKANRDSLADRASILANLNLVKPANARTGLPGIDWIKVTGPVRSDNRWPDRSRQASKALKSADAWKGWFPDFLSRAFRRELKAAELNRYQEIYDEEIGRGRSHQDAALRVVLAVLVSPNFLYRAEEIPVKAGDQPFELTSPQLASRLSYFLWQTMPDAELIGTDLKDETELTHQVSRMLSDWRAEIFFSTFPGQWLGYEALGVSVIPDEKKFPFFSPVLAESMKTETGLWFQHVFQRNLTVIDLLRSGKTYLNEDLARHYGIEGEFSEEFRMVSLSGDQKQRRGGLLGMGSVLTATSTPVRTSPVLRGVFVMERLLGDDPGLPPADAGELPGNAGGRGKTLREELALHRDAPACASCHDKIDPIGFGLDYFDAVGRYREKENGKPIDARGELPDGTVFQGAQDLRNYIIEKRKEDFARIFVERLLSYALGRELQTYDEPAIVRILEKTRPDHYRARDIIEAIATSYPFRNQHPDADWNP